MIKGFKILDRNDIRDSLLSYREKGALRGMYLGFPKFNEHYTMSLPGVTDWTGFPGSGKSEFLLENLLNTSLFYGWRHLLYVPDVGDKNEIYSLLIHKKTGKTFDKRYVNSNYISEQEVEKEMEFMLHHFLVLNKDDLKAKITPYQFWDLAAKMNSETEGGIQTATIDSWKDMKHGIGMDNEVFQRDDKYLEDVLSYRNAMAEKHKMHFHIIAHPNKTEKDANGKRTPPSPFDLKGGQEWNNSGKVMITCHRVDGTFNEVDIIITKAKPKSVAKLGTCKFFLNVQKNQYYEDSEQGHIYASEKRIKPIGIEVHQELIDDEDDGLPF
jgi:hypothetical protein